MKPERIKALIDLMAESDLIELSLSEEGTQVRLLREPGHSGAPVMVGAAPLAPPPPPVGVSPTAPASAASDAGLVKAALYGIVHFTPAPDQPPFIEVGSRVKAGQTLAVLEAMKMFHPLKAPVDGVVEAILVSAGAEVDAGQALVRIA